MTTLRKVGRLRAILTGVVLFGGVTAVEAATITAPIGSEQGSGAAFTFVGADDGYVWLMTNYGGTWHWQELVALNVSFGVGVTSLNGYPSAYAVGTDGNLYEIYQAGQYWAKVNVGTPPGVALRTPVGVISDSNSQPYVFLIGSDGNLWMAHAVGSWAWTNLFRPSGVTIGAPVGAGNAADYSGHPYPQIFVLGIYGNLWASQYDGSSYPWSRVGTPPTGVIAMGLGVFIGSLNGTSFPQVLVEDRSNPPNLYIASQYPPPGGPWTWQFWTGIQPVAFPVGMTPGAYAVLCFYTTSNSLARLNNGTTAPVYTNLAGTSYAAKASAGVTDFGVGPYVFLIATSGDLEVVYGTSGNLGNAQAIDLGVPP